MKIYSSQKLIKNQKCIWMTKIKHFLKDYNKMKSKERRIKKVWLKKKNRKIYGNKEEEKRRGGVTKKERKRTDIQYIHVYIVSFLF